MKADTRLVISTVLLLGAVFPANAASWREISVTSDQVIYADTINVLRRGDFVRAWEREVFAREQEGEGLSDPYKSIKVLTHYDCSNRTATPVIRIYYQANGVEIRRFRVEGLLAPAAIEPDSPRELIFKDVCPDAAIKVAKDGHGETGSSRESKNSTMDHGEHGKSEQKSKDKPNKTAKAHANAAQKSDHSGKVHAVKGGRVEAAAEHSDSVAMHEVHWTYSGPTGVEHWGDLKSEWSTCATGEQQSPIDIRDGARLNLESIEFAYRLSPLRIVDNGHTVQVNYGGGSAITVGGMRYDLLQVHFHKPSEERVNGRVYDMVAHLVHRSGDGRLAVVAVLFEIGEENPFIKALWPHLPLEKNREIIMSNVLIPLESVLPADRGYYTYMGSLTTPPCTEGVLWMVMKTPVSISPNQVGVFGRLYPMNSRPVQAANGRFIKESM